MRKSSASFGAESTGVVIENDVDLNKNSVKLKHLKVIWHRVILLVFLCFGAMYGVFLMITSAKILTTIYGEY